MFPAYIARGNETNKVIYDPSIWVTVHIADRVMH